MKILIDTNIIVDVALERQAYLEESEQVLFLVEQGRFQGYISASTFSDLYYIIRKQKGRVTRTPRNRVSFALKTDNCGYPPQKPGFSTPGIASEKKNFSRGARGKGKEGKRVERN
jgi:hypothetical protein